MTEKPKTIEWLDFRREPRNLPNPAYPLGVDLDCSGGKPACTVPLKSPAKRCGVYLIVCECGASVMATTAGRHDDPRSIKMPCKL